MGRFVRPETIRLTLANGDTLTVKKRLSVGEHRARLGRMYLAGIDGAFKVNLLAIGVATITAYLVDWHLVGEDVPAIRGLSIDDLVAVLDNLEPDSFNEIKEAIEAHEAAMDREREASKNGTGGAMNSAAISPSPSAADKPLSGSVN